MCVSNVSTAMQFAFHKSAPCTVRAQSGVLAARERATTKFIGQAAGQPPLSALHPLAPSPVPPHPAPPPVHASQPACAPSVTRAARGSPQDQPPRAPHAASTHARGLSLDRAQYL